MLRQFAAALDPNETLFLTSLFGKKPDYVVEWLQEPVQPHHRNWVDARELLDAITPDDEEMDFWEPGPRWYRLNSIVNNLYQLAFRQVPNPAYDAERAAEWRKENSHRFPLNVKKVEWGPGTLPDIPPGVLGVDEFGNYIYEREKE